MAGPSPVVGDILAHHGIKGMRWGVRRSDTSGSHDVSVVATPGKRVQTSGGHGHTPHEDAVKAAISKQKAKASSIDSLGNPELKALVERMNLEQQYSKLTTNTRKPGATKFITDILQQVGRQQISAIANDQAKGFLARAMSKAATG